ncbi:MAG: glycerol-3-phosphate ABC transporter ATP-binding protein [Ignavibacteriales bacterium CG07_land_8_20_14_0_80_59_12]|nr:MAG: glycerol-3-phosphate ABC transporter ATP-binding protein [Ignavibacteriales bacterium CG07_land_8_20_14_0_80_59_12]
MAEVNLEHVTKKYDGGVTAVNDVSFQVADNEFVVLVGPSGCGKTTTLRMIAGLEEVTSGTISIGGKVVNDVDPKNRDIAMVFQNYALYPHMTVYENMAFGLKLRKYPKAEIETRVKEAAQILGIQDFLDRKPKVLSGGQRQRVAVGRAIVRKPKAFLFDEPLSNLDAKLRVQMRTEISRLHHRLSATMVYVTHDQTEAMTMGDRIVLMKDGIIHQIDTPLNLYDHPVNKFAAGFIGSPAMNFFTGSITRDGGLQFRETSGVHFKLGGPLESSLGAYEGRTVVLGLRPEHIGIAGITTPASEATVPLKATVDVVEPMGNEIFVYFFTGSGTQYVSRVPAHRMLSHGEHVEFLFDCSRAHVFDTETEKAI